MSDLFFDYELPECLIAQHPAERRDEARLLVLNRVAGSITHHRFRDLPQFLNPNDLLVLNDTKVIPARVVGMRAGTGGKWEGLFLRQTTDGAWEMLAQTRGYPEIGERFLLDSGGVTLTLVGRTPDRHWLMTPDRPGSAPELLAEHGHVPLPPYIRKGVATDADRDRYQTVYATAAGSVAAPTAGLHFTPELLDTLKHHGVNRARVTLHVGLGTFAPVKVENPREHPIHSEWGEVRAETAEAIRRTQAAGGRVVGVGTTTARLLESAARTPEGVFHGETSLFIHPPFEFQALNALITNFHLPRTTLLLLVQAFAGCDLLRRAYWEAVRAEYRFFSYGDAMLIT
jgi:S-adenosylmethionine:tRNA ribosyltransferase-isomerase